MSAPTAMDVLAMGRAFHESRVLLTGAELGIYGLLAREALDVSAIARKLGLDAEALEILLDALAAMELLTKTEGRYRVQPTLADALSNTSERTVVPMLLHSNGMWDRWGGLSDVVRNGRSAQRTARSEGAMRAFIGAMHAIGAVNAPAIIEAVRPGNARRLLDVGGASGTYTMAFLRAAPVMRATIFDLPPVIELARERLGAAGLLDRVDLVAGDYNADPLPPGHDLAFLSAIIHQNSHAENVALYRSVYAALVPGGRVVIRDHVLSPDRTRPRPGAMFAINMLVGTPGGNSYTHDEIAGGLAEAGFERVALLQPDERMDGLVEGYRPS